MPTYTIRTPFPPGGTQPHPRRRRLRDLPLIGPALAYLVGPWSQQSDTKARLMQHDDRLSTLEGDMIAMTGAVNENAAAQEARAAQIAALLKAEFASLRSQLDAALADDAAEVDAAVKQALNADSERVGKLLDTFADILPGANAPVVETPAPGEPAVIPAEETPAEQGPVSSDDVITAPEVLTPSEGAEQSGPGAE